MKVIGHWNGGNKLLHLNPNQAGPDGTFSAARHYSDTKVYVDATEYGKASSSGKAFVTVAEFNDHARAKNPHRELGRTKYETIEGIRTRMTMVRLEDGKRYWYCEQRHNGLRTFYRPVDSDNSR